MLFQCPLWNPLAHCDTINTEWTAKNKTLNSHHTTDEEVVSFEGKNLYLL